MWVRPYLLFNAEISYIIKALRRFIEHDCQNKTYEDSYYKDYAEDS